MTCLAISYRFSTPREHWLFTAPQCLDSEEPTWFLRLAVLQYSVLRTTNAARRQGILRGPETIRALRQALVEGVRNHRLAVQIRSAVRAQWRPGQS